jgi:16S rRNA (uracil1498-N3)-methyltransferase
MRIFIPPEDIKDKQRVKVSPEKSRYLLTVLRSKVGDVVELIDGAGRTYEAVIDTITKGDVFLAVTREIMVNNESPVRLVLCQGILKGEKMDLVIQKATELGVHQIVPLITERSIVKETRKVSRWRKITEESAEQCGRAVVPTVHEPVELSLLFMAHSSLPLKGLIFWEKGGAPVDGAFSSLPFPQGFRITDPPVHLFIGPEGGFTSEEVEHAEERGLVRATLGRRILRAETAAIVSVALVQFFIESGRAPESFRA